MTANKQPAFHKLVILSLFFASCSLFFTSVPAFAQETSPKPTEYKLLAPIPLEGAGGKSSETANTATYIKGLFQLAIGLAGGLAVLMLVYAGIKYMSTDAFGGKEEAKGIIENAIWGLLLAIASWTILYTINPKLVEINLNIPQQEIKPTVTGPGTGGGGGGACNDCDVISVSHKTAPTGCAAPGPCVINKELNAKLVELNKLQSLQVTESYPPTRPHQNACHTNGTCVDAKITSAN
jgi:hypothetical protein